MAIETPKSTARAKPAAKTAARKTGGTKTGAAKAGGAKAGAGKASARRATLKPVAVAAPVDAGTPSVAVVALPGDGAGKGATLRKKDLVERVVTASGARKKDVREIVEAVLGVLGDALHAGEILALPPFGKARVNRQKDTAGGETLVVKLRRGKAPGSAKETLAETAELG